MEPYRSRWAKLLFVAVVVMLAGQSLAADVLDKTKDIAGATIHYKVILPNGYDPAKAYPAVLAFPGGPQTMDTVEGTVERNWREQWNNSGYIDHRTGPRPMRPIVFRGRRSAFQNF